MGERVGSFLSAPPPSLQPLDDGQLLSTLHHARPTCSFHFNQPLFLRHPSDLTRSPVFPPRPSFVLPLAKPFNRSISNRRETELLLFLSLSLLSNSLLKLILIRLYPPIVFSAPLLVICKYTRASYVPRRHTFTLILSTTFFFPLLLSSLFLPPCNSLESNELSSTPSSRGFLHSKFHFFLFLFFLSPPFNSFLNFRFDSEEEGNARTKERKEETNRRGGKERVAFRWKFEREKVDKSNNVY